MKFVIYDSFAKYFSQNGEHLSQKNHCVNFPLFLSINITFYDAKIHYEILTSLHKLGNFSLYIWKARYTCEWILKIERIIHLLFKNGKLICHKILPTLKKSFPFLCLTTYINDNANVHIMFYNG
jgi:hypothetical protein